MNLEMFLSSSINENIVITVLGVVIFLLLLMLFVRRRSFAYQQATLFTPAEKHFFYALEATIPKGYRIFGKVRIGDIVTPDQTLSQKRQKELFWKVSNKHFDYLICTEYTLNPVFAIELNDKSHLKKDRMDRDKLVSKVCASANFPLLWVQTQSEYNLPALKEKISRLIYGYENPKKAYEVEELEQ